MGVIPADDRPTTGVLTRRGVAPNPAATALVAMIAKACAASSAAPAGS